MVNAWYYIRQTRQTNQSTRRNRVDRRINGQCMVLHQTTRQTNQSTRRNRVDRILNGQCMVPIAVCRVFWAGAFITFIY